MSCIFWGDFAPKVKELLLEKERTKREGGQCNKGRNIVIDFLFLSSAFFLILGPLYVISLNIFFTIERL